MHRVALAGARHDESGEPFSCLSGWRRTLATLDRASVLGHHGCRRNSRAARKAHDEFAALAEPCAVRLDAASVHLDELLHQSQANAEPPLGAIQAVLDLCEHNEYLVEHVGGHADAMIAP